MLDTFSITNKTKGKLPSLPFALIKDDILGKDYDLSIACVNEAQSRTLNSLYRGKDKPTNILSFSLSKNNGEIILCPKLIKKESRDDEKNFGKNFPEFFLFLVIHGMLHLKGYEHSSRMEKREKLFYQKYEKHISGHRHRDSHHPHSSGRISKRRKKS